MRRRGCLTSARLNMTADILKPPGAPESNPTPEGEPGSWEYYQDPDSGAIVQRWVDDPTTDAEDFENESLPWHVIPNVPVMARGVLTGGLTGAGTTEIFDDLYTNVDWVKATFPSNVNITKRDRVTNVRASNGEVAWKEEEIAGNPATIFNVMGVTPVLDPFSRLVEYAVLLQRAEVQSG